MTILLRESSGDSAMMSSAGVVLRHGSFRKGIPKHEQLMGPGSLPGLLEASKEIVKDGALIHHARHLI